MTAHEEAYLEQLGQMIATPGRSPYIQRAPSKPQAEGPPAIKPVFDSGPMPAEITAAPQAAKSAAKPAGRGRPASLATEDGHIRLGEDGVYEIDIDVPMADLEQWEDDRKPKVAERPKPRPRPVVEAKAPPAPIQPPPEATAEPETDEPRDLFPPGTLVIWNGNQLGIYKEHLKQKGYDLLYVVEQDGRLQPKGVCLFAYNPQRVGCLSEGILQWMEQTMRWERGALVVHFDNPGDLEKIAALRGEPAAQPAVGREERVETVKDDPMLVRGRLFTITVGRHKWNGVYWGRNTIGTIVAHNTNRTWSLMHLDLERFGPSVKFGVVLPRKKIREIEAVVSNQE